MNKWKSKKKKKFSPPTEYIAKEITKLQALSPCPPNPPKLRWKPNQN